MQEKTSTIYNDNNVYILGAGFSRLARLPLINDFMNQMRDTDGRLDYNLKNPNPFMTNLNGIERLRKTITDVLKYRLEASSVNFRINLDLENIEQLFSLASLSADENLDRNIRLAICATIEGAYELFYKTNPTRKVYNIFPEMKLEFPISLPYAPNSTDNNKIYEINLYTLILAQLIGSSQLLSSDKSDCDKNTFITMNYDRVIEDSISNLKIPFTYSIKEEDAEIRADKLTHRFNSGVKVLKLHGSTNWIEPTEHSKKIQIFNDFYFPAYEEGKDNIPYILPPTWNKSARGILRDVWLESIKSIRNATRIVIIGYSFPSTDNHINYLISEGLRDNISLRKIHCAKFIFGMLILNKLLKIGTN